MRHDADLATRHHARLLATFAVILGTIDVLAAAQCHAFTSGRVRVVVPETLLVAAIAACVAYVANRRGAFGWALVLLVATQLVVPTTITVLLGDWSPVSTLNLGVWFAVPILLTAPFVSCRWVLAVGGASALVFFVAMIGMHVLSANTCSAPLVFILTVSSLAAVITEHRDRLDALRQNELLHQNAELTAMRDTLEARVEERTDALLTAEKMALIGRLTAGIAHEMASPLAAVLSTVDSIKDLANEYAHSIGDPRVTDEDHRAIASELMETADLAVMASQRSAHFVRSIRSQTRVTLAGRRERFDAAALVEDCVSLLAHAARSAKCTIEIHATRPLFVWSSPGRLAQAITNLLQNAIDATGERMGGAVHVDVESNDAGALRILVRDAAGGIASDVLSRIFEPLFTTKPFGRGTGLGLAIVKEAVETDLGGHVDVETNVGVGSMFVIELPKACVEASDAA